MKKETSNQFTEGLVSDLNPINTPNTVLTDNLNGTIITYNGNEFSLQNDMGNYELKNCRLSPNYIPVGVKEYGDILYIVSHNPIKNTVEIGSYPSPLAYSSVENPSNENECVSIIKKHILDSGLKEREYSYLMDQSNSIIFNGEDYKLNPGDEYSLQVVGEKIPYKYETVEFQILDENSSTHDVTDKISINSNDFEHIPWTVPGWLNIHPRLAMLSSAGINIKSFYVPKTESELKTAYFSFDFRINVQDPFLIKNGVLDDWCNNIKELKDVRFRLFIEKLENGEYKSIYNEPYLEFGISDIENNNICLGEFNWSEWFGDSRTLWKSVSGEIHNITLQDSIKITIIPILYEEKYDYKIVYDNVKQDVVFDLWTKEETNWEIGEELYQFYTSSDKKKQIINIDVKGPKISAFPIDLYCDIFDLNGNLLKEDILISDYSGIGENQFAFSYDEIFQKEDIYIIRFNFKNKLSSEIIYSVGKILITSEIFNDYVTITRYDQDIPLEKWISDYFKKTSKVLNFKYSDFSTTAFSENPKLTEADKKYFSNKKNNSFFPANQIMEDLIYRRGYNHNVNVITRENEIKYLSGPLWDTLEPNFKYKYKVSNSNDLKELPGSSNEVPDSNGPQLPEKGSVEVPDYIESVYKYVKSNNEFLFADIIEKDFINNLSDYTGIKDIGKITDYKVKINIHVTGTGKSEKEEDEHDDVKRTAKCWCAILKNEIPIKGSWIKDIESILNKFIIPKNEENTSIWHTDDGYLYWKVTKMGVKGVCLLPKLITSWVLREYKLPFVHVEISYTLARKSANWQLHNNVFGSEGNPNFYFHLDNDGSRKQQFVAFVGRHEEKSDDFTKSENPEDWPLPNWAPTLIPLTTASVGDEYFDNLCNGLTYVEENPTIQYYDTFNLNNHSHTLIKPILDIYLEHFFNESEYKGINFKNFSKNLELLNKRFPELNLNKNLLTGDSFNSSVELVHSFKFDSSITEDHSSWPYQDYLVILGGPSAPPLWDVPGRIPSGNLNVKPKTLLGIYSWENQLIKLNSHSANDLQLWTTSSIYTKVMNGEDIRGIYSKNSNSKLMLALTDSFIKIRRFSLYGAIFNKDAAGDTSVIVNDIDTPWWVDVASALMVGSLTIYGVIQGINYAGHKEAVTALNYLLIGNKASWFSWTNKQFLLDTEALVYYVYGTPWREQSDISLEEDQTWITLS